MKIRTDFVTNSSSSSYIVVYQVKYNDELKEFMEKEYGKYGLKLLDKYVMNGKEAIKNEEIQEIQEYHEIDFDESKYYLSAQRISWTNEGDTEGDDCWLLDHLPDSCLTEIFIGE